MHHHPPGAAHYQNHRIAVGVCGCFTTEVESGQHAAHQTYQPPTHLEGEIWRFPRATAVPKPLQAPHPPIWVAARVPGTFAWAIVSGANIMATPLSRPHAEVVVLGQRFADTLAKFPGITRPRFLMLRQTCVYPREDDWLTPVRASAEYTRTGGCSAQAVSGRRPGSVLLRGVIWIAA